MIDLIIENKIKKNVQKEIAEILDDDLINLNDKNITLSNDEKNFIDIEQYKKETSDNPTDITKTFTKIVGLAVSFISKVVTFARIGAPIIGCFIGSIISGIVMNCDINKYIEFYGKRLVYRYLVNLSFDIIEEYLKNTFET